MGVREGGRRLKRESDGGGQSIDIYFSPSNSLSALSARTCSSAATFSRSVTAFMMVSLEQSLKLRETEADVERERERRRKRKREAAAATNEE